VLPFSRYWRLKLESRWIFTPHPSLRLPSGGTPLDIDVIYTSLKSAFNGLQFRCWHYRSIFIRLAVAASQSREITWNSYKIWPYSSSRSSKVIDLGVNLIVTLAVSATIFEILTLKARKSLNFHTPPFFEEAPVRGNPLEFGDEIWRQKTRIMGLPDSEEIMTLAFFVLTQYRRVTDGQTDRQTRRDRYYPLA